jgi:hypothetical protein
MYPPIFATCLASAPLTAVIGTSPCRCFLFGEATPTPPDAPYIVWQIVAGGPENTLADAPTVARYSLQVDIYGKTAASARSTASLFRSAVQAAAHVTGFNGEFREAETGLFRVSLTVDWLAA